MLPDEPRTVKPRQPTGQRWLPLIVAHRDSRSIFCEMTGEVYGWDEAPTLFRRHPPSVVIVVDAAQLLAELELAYAHDAHWQYRVAPVKRERYNIDPERVRRRIVATTVNYFGWQGATRASGKSNRKGHWHYPVDPALFCAAPVRDLLGGTAPSDLLAWGRDLREWCNANELHPSPTAGGLAGQLLRDPRWYPQARRKVPRATNARARAILPGNHYRLYWPLHKSVNATYLDMSASHHQMASWLDFPCANGLFARGDFRTTDTTETPVPRDRLWAPKGTPVYNRVLQSYGLLRLQVNVPAIKADRFPPPFMETAGRRKMFVYSNELPLIRALGGEIEGIVAAWVSFQRDTGLNQFAQWALTEIATMDPVRKRWAKTVLLAVYGNLAAKSRAVEYGYRNATAGIPREYPAGPTVIQAQAYLAEREQEVPTVNVIHRGMIEAEQRRVVLDMARDLTEQGHAVLALYADAIMVKAGRALPLLPPPWRIDAHLTRLKFATPTAFTSVERTKLPGIARDDAERWSRIAHIRPRA